MPPKLPQVSGQDIVKLLQRLGYWFVRQRGSHIRMRKIIDAKEHNITIPDHDVLDKGTLNDILSDIAEKNKIAKSKLIEILKRH